MGYLSGWAVGLLVAVVIVGALFRRCMRERVLDLFMREKGDPDYYDYSVVGRSPEGDPHRMG